MNRLITLSLLVALIMCGCSTHKTRMHLVGDSTMADYDENVTQMRGWGEMFRFFVPEDIIVLDHAQPGRSSRSFYDEGRWNDVKTQVNEGDFVLIQFAHNDEKEQGEDGADGRGTAPWTTYRSYLMRYINETRELGATPILVQPIVRRYFNGNYLTAKGKHNLGVPVDTLLDYTAAMRSVAITTQTPIIDLCSKSAEIVEAYGPTASKEQLFVQADNTHTSMKGAALFALAVAEALDTMGVWEPGSVRHPKIITNQHACDLGEVFIGDTAWQTFDAIDFDGMTTLRPGYLSHRGNITFVAPPGLKISANLMSPRVDSLNVYTNCGANVIVHYSPRASLRETIKLKVVTPSGTAYIPIKAVGRKLSHTEQLSWVWTDIQKQNDVTELSSKLTTIKGLTFTDKGFTSLLGYWPSEIDENGDRYIQFTFTAGGRAVKIRNVALKASGDFSYRMAAALGKDFYRNKVIGERQHAVDADFSSDSFSTSIYLKPGQNLLVRIYPWRQGASDNAAFSVKDVAVDAIVME